MSMYSVRFRPNSPPYTAVPAHSFHCNSILNSQVHIAQQGEGINQHFRLIVHDISNMITTAKSRLFDVCCLPVSGVLSHPHREKRSTEQLILSVCYHRSHSEWHELNVHWLSVLPVSSDTNFYTHWTGIPGWKPEFSSGVFSLFCVSPHK